MRSRDKGNKLRRVEKKAIRLLRDPRFFYMAGHKVSELGVVGEKRNRLILTLAGIARALPKTPSVLVKGPPSSGKSTLSETVVQLFPPDCVVKRAGLSGKALVHGEGSLAHKILFIHEYRCGKDAQQLLRLLQSEGRIAHEFTTVHGARRGTKTAERVGMPVVLSTTTEEKVFPDDEARFLSLWVDDSPRQNLAILKARAKGPRVADSRDLPVWQTAMSLLKCKKGDFEHPPDWLQYVAEQLPRGSVGVRRDRDRFLALCSAVALWRGFRSGHPTDIEFTDYCIAYRILEPVFASTLPCIRTPEVTLAKTVRKLNKRLQRAVTVREVAHELGWKNSLVYKHVKAAVRQRLVKYESGTRERNVKRVLPRDDAMGGFLPSPRLVLKNNPEIDNNVRYVDPFTGTWKKVGKRRRQMSGKG
jgi:hypothetical protein